MAVGVFRVSVLWLLGGACGNTGNGTPAHVDNSVGQAGVGAPLPGMADGGNAGSGTGVGGAESSTAAASGTGVPAGAASSGWCRGDATVLGKVASKLAPRTWAQLPDNASLAALDMDDSLLYWADSATWEPVGRQVRWVGGPGVCCADPAVFQMMVYDVSSDTWSMEATPFSGSGHAYDGNAVQSEPDTSYYFALFQDRQVKTWQDDIWGALPDLPWDAAPAVGLTWFADLGGGSGGLLYVNGSGLAAWHDGAKWNEIFGAEAAPWGDYNTFAEVNPALKLVWLGAGNGAETRHYMLDASAKLTQLADAPFSLNVGSTLHCLDPISGKYIVNNRKDNNWWEFDIAADEWTSITTLMNAAPDFADAQAWSMDSVFQVPVPECGVILFFSHYGEHRTVYVYRN